MRIEYYDHKGGTQSVLDTARASFGKKNKVYTAEENTKLLHYLAKHHHTSPFRHASITLQARVPEFVARQWYKHVVGSEWSYKDTAWNEISGRYIPYDEWYMPEDFHRQHEKKKQGASVEVHPESQYFIHKAKVLQEITDALYKEMISAGVAFEEARIILPLTTYTEFYWSPSMQAAAHFCVLRQHQQAQTEIRFCADIVHNICLSYFGEAYEILHHYLSKSSEN
jgi:thymidylate synthase (FAD)